MNWLNLLNQKKRSVLELNLEIRIKGEWQGRFKRKISFFQGILNMLELRTLFFPPLKDKKLINQFH